MKTDNHPTIFFFFPPHPPSTPPADAGAHEERVRLVAGSAPVSPSSGQDLQRVLAETAAARSPPGAPPPDMIAGVGNLHQQNISDTQEKQKPRFQRGRPTQVQNTRGRSKHITRRHPQSSQCQRGRNAAKTQLPQRLLKQEIELARGRLSLCHSGVLLEGKEAQHLLPHLDGEHPEQLALPKENETEIRTRKRKNKYEA